MATTTTAIDARRLAALLQLASPALPVGAFSYSQGLEAAIEAGAVHDALTARAWILDHAEFVLGRFEVPVWLRLHAAFTAGDDATAQRWNARFIASRDTREARAETLQMGHSLQRLLTQLDLAPAVRACAAAALADTDGPALAWPATHAAACVALGVDAAAGALALLYSAVENQVTAALKAVPLGQADGQRLLLAAHPVLERTLTTAQALDDDALGTAAPLLAVHGAHHETQYSRLFRS